MNRHRDASPRAMQASTTGPNAGHGACMGRNARGHAKLGGASLGDGRRSRRSERMEPAMDDARTVAKEAEGPLSPDLLRRMDAWWRAANFLSVGQIYLRDNPLLKSPLTMAHIKPRLLGHWGTTTGLNFLYVHLNRLITENDLDMMYVIGPGPVSYTHLTLP